MPRVDNFGIPLKMFLIISKQLSKGQQLSSMPPTNVRYLLLTPLIKMILLVSFEVSEALNWLKLHIHLCTDTRQDESSAKKRPHPCRREENKHFHSLINLVEQMDTVISAKTILPRVLTFLPFIRKGVLPLVNNFPIIAKTFVVVDYFVEMENMLFLAQTLLCGKGANGCIPRIF